MTSPFRHKHPGDPYTFTTPLERRIPRPGPSRLTRLEQRVEVLEEECWWLGRKAILVRSSNES